MYRKCETFRVGSVVGVALSLGLASSLALADPPVATTLSNGAALDVQILNPGDSMEFIVPAGTTDINVNVDGTASVGQGDPDATIIIIGDRSGSTSVGTGTGCAPILSCEKIFFNNLTTAAINDGSTDLMAVASYGSSASTDQGLVDPTTNAITTAVNAWSAGGATNCEAGLANAQALNTSAANTNGTTIMVFASDGACNTGNQVAPTVAAIAATGAIVHSVAIGSGSNCTSNGGTGTLNQITANGGVCTAVPDPGNLPSIIQNLIGSSLDLLEIQVDLGGFNTIPNSEISLPLPQPGAVGVTYGIVNPTTLPNLGPADHTVDVRATGSDVLGDQQSVTDAHTFHLLQLTASPPSASNELSNDNAHTVVGEIIGGTGPDRNIDFSVGGQNAATALPNAASISETPGDSTPVNFNYTVPIACTSLGTDTINVSTVIASTTDSINVTKDWVDTIAPVAGCVPTENPHGNKKPGAPGQGGQGQNQDGYYELLATDNLVTGCAPLDLFITDNGSGTVFGPFAVGTKIKYTQEPPPVSPEIKPIGGRGGPNNANDTDWHIIGNGDGELTAVDGAGNVSSVATCLVPEAPK
jgi:hypothetical protein